MKQYDVLVALYTIQKLMEKEEYEAVNELVENLISVYDKSEKIRVVNSVKKKSQTVNNISNDNWNDILIRFKEEFDIPDISYKCWIVPLSFESVDNDVLHLQYNGDMSDCAISYIKRRYLDLLSITIEEITGNTFQKIIISKPD
ncbi:MAG: hypothetical protein K6G64_00490 [Eubacterium sp.]|nr:hypothetical protein [Eubacterium sp.]